MTYQVLETSLSTMVRRYDETMGKQISGVHSMVTRTNQVPLISTRMSSSALRVECRETVYKSYLSEKE